ncbi:hypothetical protein GIB67_001936 [Kingdonia uniflora]|uniref:prephenate dehydratase n=1 Tax=Kingdonia uniflora TaxID=39325 RepID=A0A7J7NVI8_9MAGN|nr:hypothetical protein GIB67_001936 [Kingdonia uniflora]
MALRVPIPTTCLRTGYGSARTETRNPVMGVRNSTAIRAVLKQKPKPKPKQVEVNKPVWEEVERLERMFREEKYGSGDNPSPSTGFSGSPVRVAYQGVRGSYCQEAATKAFASSSNAIPCTRMEDAFEALEDKSAHRAIIAVENSIDGTIDRNLDLLLRHKDVSIIGELIIPVNHCLLAHPGASRAQIKRIVSHPQALDHCKTRLQLLDIEIVEVANAADAAQFLSENCVTDTAVIGSKIAAKEFGLQVLHENFQDPVPNCNRFLQLGFRPSMPVNTTFCSGEWKTTVAFTLNNGVSDLFRALSLFENRNVTVTKVEQRPNRSNPIRVMKNKTRDTGCFDYVFIVDLNGNVSDSGITSSLARLEEISGFLRVLGSYTCGSIC